MEYEKIGIITKPQGLKGEFRVKPDRVIFDYLKDLTTVFIKNKEYKVEKVVLKNTFAIFKIDSSNSCEDAESLRNEEIFMQKEETEECEEGEYFTDKLIGSIVCTNTGKTVGKLLSIANYGSADVFILNSDGKEVMFPNARDVIISFDEEKNILLVDENILNEILV